MTASVFMVTSNPPMNKNAFRIPTFAAGITIVPYTRTQTQKTVAWTVLMTARVFMDGRNLPQNRNACH